MLSHTDLKKGVLFIYNGQPYSVLDFALNFQGRGSSTVQTRIKNLITGNVLTKVFHSGDTFEEAELKKIQLKFVYANPVRNLVSNGASKGQYVFSEIADPSKRLALNEEQIAAGQFLKPGQLITGLSFNNKVINIETAIKTQLKVKSAAAYLQAGRAEAGTKEIILETGAKIQAPSFIKEGDIVEINTQTGEYSCRVD